MNKQWILKSNTCFKHLCICLACIFNGYFIFCWKLFFSKDENNCPNQIFLFFIVTLKYTCIVHFSWLFITFRNQLFRLDLYVMSHYDADMNVTGNFFTQYWEMFIMLWWTLTQIRGLAFTSAFGWLSFGKGDYWSIRGYTFDFRDGL